MINLKTAKALGLTIPETLLATADQVIHQRSAARSQDGCLFAAALRAMAQGLWPGVSSPGLTEPNTVPPREIGTTNLVSNVPPAQPVLWAATPPFVNVRRSAEWTMNEAQLATLVSRDSMIGTGIPTVQETRIMNGMHDVGGMDGFGPVVVEKNEPVFNSHAHGHDHAED